MDPDIPTPQGDGETRARPAFSDRVETSVRKRQVKPDEATAMRAFIEHYSMRILDLLGIPVDRKDLRWSP